MLLQLICSIPDLHDVSITEVDDGVDLQSITSSEHVHLAA